MAIAGCGIAGLACARFLALAGWRVVVFDRMTTPAPIGSGLIVQPVGLEVLDALGLGEEVRACGMEISRLFGKVQPSGRVVLDVGYGKRSMQPRRAVGAHRGALFRVLLEGAEQAGAAVEFGREVAGVEGGRLLFADGGRSAAFDLAIDALGVWSPLSRAPDGVLPYGALWTNVDWPEGDGRFMASALEQRYERARKMVGVLPVGALAPGRQRMASFFWSLKHGDFDAWRRGGLVRWKDDVLALWPETEGLLAQIVDADQLVFATYAHRTLGGVIGDGVLHVGDSWHCASPQLGQGANMALLDAYALARALETHGDLDGAVASYERMRRWHVRLYQAVSWMFTPAYQSDGAVVSGLRDWVMAPLSRVPPGPAVLSSLVSGTMGGPLAAIRRHGEAGIDDRRLPSVAGSA